ncbi:MAG: hypothetical protein M3R54_09405 [Chloroflexota bacterium]|nr:hypothetical protein [Chloroflexota bacterium]
MTTDVGYLFAIAAVSMSLSSLAGLVIAFRRSGTWAVYDLFRLRQIVGYGFANVILALFAFPLAGLLGSERDALRLIAAITFVYVVVNLLVLKNRVDRLGRPAAIRYSPLIIVIDIAIVIVCTATMILGTMPTWELLLLLLVTRPMLAFALVLATLGQEGDAA